MPANLERAWEHILRAYKHLPYISVKTMRLLFDALDMLHTMMTPYLIACRANLAAGS